MGKGFFFFKQKTAYEIHRRLELRRVLFRSDDPGVGYRLTVLAVIDRHVRPGGPVRDPSDLVSVGTPAFLRDRPRKVPEIGRASCREREGAWVGGDPLKKHADSDELQAV